MLLRILLSLLMVITACGCGGADHDPPRRLVEGAVTFNDQPIEYGMIRFIPQPDGPIVTSMIQQGHYSAQNKGGVPLGKVRVEVISMADPSKMEGDAMNPAPVASPLVIPEKFNTSSILEETIAVGSGTQMLDFHLKGK